MLTRVGLLLVIGAVVIPTLNGATTSTSSTTAKPGVFGRLLSSSETSTTGNEGKSQSSTDISSTTESSGFFGKTSPKSETSTTAPESNSQSNPPSSTEPNGLSAGPGTNPPGYTPVTEVPIITTTEKRGFFGSVADGVGAAAAGAATGVRKVAAAAGEAVGHARYAVSRSNDSVCYEGLGCFSLRPPWKRSLIPEPDTPDAIDTRFYLYTRASPQRFNVTTYPEVDLRNTDYQPQRRTFIITHGFSSDGNSSWLSDMKDALLEAVDANVFLTDWGAGAKEGNYYQVAANTRIVGAEIARLLGHLQGLGTPYSNVHLLGHSLGAQISSYAAKQRRGIARITAMDPAQPAFEGYDAQIRLDPSDALFVDVIHTNAKPFVPLLGFGMMRAAGHVDFYMNGGADQPGCEIPKPDAIQTLGDIAKIPVSAVAKLVSCSHGRSYEYMTEAITSKCRMWGHKVSLAKQLANWATGGHLAILTTKGKCEPGACIPLGLDTPEYPARGTYSVGTAPSSPYCVKETSDDGQDLKELKSMGIIR